MPVQGLWRCYLELISVFWLAWMCSFCPALIQEFILHAPSTPECTCAGKRGKQFHFSLLLEEKTNPPPPPTFSPASPFHILTVSICHTWSVSTGSDAMTWCNDALEHFLQKMYISVQMLDLTAISKENNSWWNVVTFENVSVTCTDILYNTKSEKSEIHSMNGCTLVGVSCKEVNDFTIHTVHSITHTEASFSHSTLSLCGVMSAETEWEKWICTHTDGQNTLFTKVSQSNRLLVSGSVWWNLVPGPWSINCELLTGPWNPSPDERITLNLSDHTTLPPKRQTNWSSPNFTS